MDDLPKDRAVLAARAEKLELLGVDLRIMELRLRQILGEETYRESVHYSLHGEIKPLDWSIRTALEMIEHHARRLRTIAEGPTNG